MCPEPPNPKNPPDPWDDSIFFGDSLGDLFEAHRPWGRSEISFLAGRSFRPASDVFESPDGLVITLEVPGIPREKIDLKVEGNLLTISGSRDFERENPDDESVRLERGFGSFRRVFEIPIGTNPESITAVLDLGVLTITVPGHRERMIIEVETYGRFE
jgi:HSP20 family molecular chaperone IbpA